jgi:quercetin dioxygenase-like cupin family protein
MALFASGKLIEGQINRQRGLDSGAGTVELKMVYGNLSNLLIAYRTADYHSDPHAHDNEQLNYCLEGGTSLHVENKRYELRPGDFHRCRRNALHWAWGNGASTLIETHTPGLSEEPHAKQGAIGLFRDGESRKLERLNLAGGAPQLNAIVDQRFYALDSHKVEISEAYGRGAIAKAADIRNLEGMSIESGIISAKMAYGELSSMLVTVYASGYHGAPRTHDAEELVYVISGGIWAFTGTESYELEAGDFLRIPRGEVHWFWNKSPREAQVFASHTPGLQACPLVGGGAESLIEADEAVRLYTGPMLGGNLPRTIFVRPESHGIDVDMVEQSEPVRV